MDLGLADLPAVVSGGSGGIGRYVARSLAREGARVVITARDEARLRKVAAELSDEAGAPVEYAVCDTAEDAAAAAGISAAARILGGIRILVNAAALPVGAAPHVSLAQLDDDVFFPDVNVKVMGYLRMIRNTVPHMAAAGGGRILNVSGLSARHTQFATTVGSIRNAAVVALTKSLAEQLAGQHITLVAVHPGMTATDGMEAMLPAAAARAGVSETEMAATMNRTSLLGRMAAPQEVGDLIAFLVSPRAQLINGEVVAIGGGYPGSIYY